MEQHVEKQKRIEMLLHRRRINVEDLVFHQNQELSPDAAKEILKDLEDKLLLLGTVHEDLSTYGGFTVQNESLVNQNMNNSISATSRGSNIIFPKHTVEIKIIDDNSSSNSHFPAIPNSNHQPIINLSPTKLRKPSFCQKTKSSLEMPKMHSVGGSKC